MLFQKYLDSVYTSWDVYYVDYTTNYKDGEVTIKFKVDGGGLDNIVVDLMELVVFSFDNK